MSIRPIAVVVAVGALALAGWIVVENGAPDVTSKSQGSRTVAAMVEPPTTSLSKHTLASLRAYGTKLTSVDPSEAGVPVSAAVASKHAVGAFRFLAGQLPSELVLGRLTVPTYGEESSEDPAKSSKVVPAISDRLVWFLVFHGIEQPRHGPVDASGEPMIKALPEKQDMWIAVDSKSGQVLGGESID